ncbi:hypothetical protein SAMN05444673_3915 [Bacillus sp. OV166]|uniref:hypothetical protein n=1 Tax=Bacillus sp. OV166 TaxID=1882763 RepID=UPI000A2AD5C7|nr:hypothetical protein [Bacillus sp. OV166]SMQ80357.1 hypothetical protein SAMN05444673_3915 [Bacillus sp. OV166]
MDSKKKDSNTYQEGYRIGFQEGQQLFKSQLINRMMEKDLILREITSIYIKVSEKTGNVKT